MPLKNIRTVMAIVIGGILNKTVLSCRSDQKTRSVGNCMIGSVRKRQLKETFGSSLKRRKRLYSEFYAARIVR